MQARVRGRPHSLTQSLFSVSVSVSASVPVSVSRAQTTPTRARAPTVAADLKHVAEGHDAWMQHVTVYVVLARGHAHVCCLPCRWPVGVHRVNLARDRAQLEQV